MLCCPVFTNKSLHASSQKNRRGTIVLQDRFDAAAAAAARYAATSKPRDDDRATVNQMQAISSRKGRYAALPAVYTSELNNVMGACSLARVQTIIASAVQAKRPDILLGILASGIRAATAKEIAKAGDLADALTTPDKVADALEMIRTELLEKFSILVPKAS